MRFLDRWRASRELDGFRREFDDLLERFDREFFGQSRVKIERLMKNEVKVRTEADTLNRAAQLMWGVDCGCVPVISTSGDGRLIGIVTDRDIAMAAYTQGKYLWAIPVGTAMSRKVVSCRAKDGIDEAVALMRDNRVRRLPIVDQSGRPVGILSSAPA
jgi:CBS domain-containing protein